MCLALCPAVGVFISHRVASQSLWTTSCRFWSEWSQRNSRTRELPWWEDLACLQLEPKKSPSMQSPVTPTDTLTGRVVTTQSNVFICLSCLAGGSRSIWSRKAVLPETQIGAKLSGQLESPATRWNHSRSGMKTGKQTLNKYFSFLLSCFVFPC